MKRVLLTSICRPLGVRYGDAPSVGYELLHGQVTLAQGLFSPRSNHVHFSLEFIAENLEAPTTVLQYPSKRELLDELQRGYDIVAVSFVVATYHRVKKVAAMIREQLPEARIVLGGYGTVLGDELLRPLCDEICREEGVGFMRRLLGEPEIEMPYRHPMIINPLKVLSVKASETGVVLAGLGCPNGCDFCCTSHFFKRRHIRLLPTGKDIYKVIERYLQIAPDISIIILDEDFLLNRRRAMAFRDCVVRGGKALSIFAFASVRAISQYEVSEILEMGIDGLWIGYEGTRSGYAKQQGRPIAEIFREFRQHGVTILASMIVGFPYQTPEIIREELDGLLALHPALTQFLIYGPSPGTPFFKRVVQEGLLHSDVAGDPDLFCRKGSGFNALVKHPSMEPAEIEAAQQNCFKEDFRRLGPSIYRSIETWHLGYLKLKTSKSPYLQLKAARFAAEIRQVYPVFLAGRLLGPTRSVRRWIGALESRIHADFGKPTWMERVQSLLALGMAAWTWFTLQMGLFQHPRLIRHTFRMPREARPARAWRGLGGRDPGGHRVEVERRPLSTVWVSVHGSLARAGAGRLAVGLRQVLGRKKERLVLDLTSLACFESEAALQMANALRTYSHRIRILLPRAAEFENLTTVFSRYQS